MTGKSAVVSAPLILLIDSVRSPPRGTRCDCPTGPGSKTDTLPVGNCPRGPRCWLRLAAPRAHPAWPARLVSLDGPSVQVRTASRHQRVAAAPRVRTRRPHALVGPRASRALASRLGHRRTGGLLSHSRAVRRFVRDRVEWLIAVELSVSARKALPTATVNTVAVGRLSPRLPSLLFTFKRPQCGGW